MKRISVILLVALISQSLTAQYFGRNKARYRSFDFKVDETPHFSLYHYSKDKEGVTWFAQELEQWHDLHSEILDHDISFKNPVILYNNHAEFQQTNAISGSIGVGTGGVTEGFKNRVVMPFTFSNQQTHQVLGHELVHAFQFNMAINGDSTTIRSLMSLPLWLIEGMAEYMSIGRVDPFTAMWMRDAVMHDDVPSLEQMANPKYFPYRYGQAAWSFLTGAFGDDIIQPFFRNATKYGIEGSSVVTLGVPLDSLSQKWESTLIDYFEPYLGKGKESTIGKVLLDKENSGRINVSPSISPNGKYVVFVSERDLFSTDLFMADARTGKVVRKLASTIKDRDLDSFNFLESTGTWSPDSKKFAFVGFSKGRNTLIIKNVESGKTIETIAPKELLAFTNPAWSPNGKEIVLTGSVEGQTDLYSYDLKKGKVRQLTDDQYSEVQASFSADGSSLSFAYDRRSFEEGRTYGMWTYDLAVMDYASGEITILDVFHGANNINPAYDHEDNILFMSDRDGYRNMYKYNTTDGTVSQMTDFVIGLSGISRYSPVLSAARKRDRVVFSHYLDHEYIMRQSKGEKLLNKPVDADDLGFAAATLPKVIAENGNYVNQRFSNIDDMEYIDQDSFDIVEYKSRFKLDNISGGVGAGINNGSAFGVNNGLQAAGALQLYFSDILGNHQLVGQAALNGTVNDFGGQLFYINRKHKLAWGGGLSHVPQAYGLGRTLDRRTVDRGDGVQVEVGVDEIQVLRIFDQTATAFVQLPFSTSLRLEGGGSVGFQRFRVDAQRRFFNLFTGQYFQGQENEKINVPDQLRFNQFFTVTRGLEGNFYVAFVGDNSFFGLTSPLMGERFRLSAERSFGINDYYAINADYRRYFRMKPFTLAFRAQGYKRYDNDLTSIYPNYIGQMGLVRGYDFVFDQREQGKFGDIGFNQLLGSSFGVGGVEVRLPFTGPRQLSLIPSKFLITDLGLFFDAGIAFNEFSDLKETGPNAPKLAMSVGASVRVNLFGAMILEPYWAYPLQKDSRVVFGLNFIPGW